MRWLKFIPGLCVICLTPPVSAKPSPLTQRAESAVAEARARGQITSSNDLLTAIEMERRAEIDRLWHASRNSATVNPTKLSSPLERQIDRLWTLVDPGQIASPGHVSDARRALARLTPTIPRLWKIGWQDYDVPPGTDLNARLDLLAEVFGRTVQSAQELRKAGRIDDARSASVDALRVLTEAYLTLGKCPGNRREMCERAGAYNLVVGALAIGLGMPVVASAIATHGPMMAWLGMLAGLIGLPTTYAGFANQGRQYGGGLPILIPDFLRTSLQRGVIETAQRSFWMMAQNHAGDLSDDDLATAKIRLAFHFEDFESDAKDQIINSLTPSLGREGVHQYCERLLEHVTCAPSAPRRTGGRPSIIFADDEESCAATLSLREI